MATESASEAWASWPKADARLPLATAAWPTATADALLALAPRPTAVD